MAPAKAAAKPSTGAPVPQAVRALLQRVLHPGAGARPDEPPLDAQLASPPEPGPDPESPSARARVAESTYDRAVAGATGVVQAQLRESRPAFVAAMAEWHSGETQVPVVIDHLAAAAAHLRGADGAMVAPTVGEALSGIARQITSGVFDAYRRAGADPDLMARLAGLMASADEQIAAGNHDTAILQLKQVLELGPHLVFSMRAFVQNLRTTFDTSTVGYSWAIAENGTLVHPWQNGRAQVGPQPVDQSATKEMNIASVSKTLTAVAVLRLLESRNLSIDSPISPWLPTTWTLGPGVAGVGGLTFRNLMTQSSGLNNNAVSKTTGKPQAAPYDYASLRSTIATGVNAPKTFVYQNANFALFRVMIPRLANTVPGVDNTETSKGVGSQAGDSFAAGSYAAAYINYLRNQLFAPMGIDGRCDPADNPNVRTLLYNPNLALSGRDAGNWTLLCGSGGWYLSATELAAYLAHMRYDNAILSPAMRTVMNQNFTGWMDPANYKWGDGVWGTYHNHGGDLWYDNVAQSAKRGMDSCVMSYPNGVQIAILINSQGPSYDGHPASGYQCAALQAAFDNALVLVP